MTICRSKRSAKEEPGTSFITPKRQKLDENSKGALKQQAELLWDVRKKLENELSKDELEKLLKKNGREKTKKKVHDKVNLCLLECEIWNGKRFSDARTIIRFCNFWRSRELPKMRERNFEF